MNAETTTTIPLRWRDMDMLGHLNQSVYHELLEDARAGHLMRQTDGDGEELFAFVLVRVELDYKHEVRKDHGEVKITVATERVGSKSVTLSHRFELPDGTVAAEGRTVLVGWDMEQRTSRELTARERESLGT